MTVGDAGQLEGKWVSAERRQDALEHVLHAMWKSGNDPIEVQFTSGALSVSDIWRETKSLLKTPLARAEIEEALEFLVAPLIGGVAKDGDKYVAAAPPQLVAARLRALAGAVDVANAGADAENASAVGQPSAPSRSASGTRLQNSATVVDASTVRAWAKSEGRSVSPRGRLPEGLIKDYRRANGLA